MRIIIASWNENKISEIKNCMDKTKYEIVGLSKLSSKFEIIEDGSTYAENAKLKAEVISKKYNCWALGDDSGLEVEALNFRPGLFSARYAPTDSEKIIKLLTELNNVKNRKAHFVTSLSLSHPTFKTISCEGRISGLITATPRGLNGFGYDPIFEINKIKKTLGELSLYEVTKYSSRSLAVKKLLINIQNS